MKIVVFEVLPHEASAFEPLRAGNELVITGEPLRARTAANFRDAQIVSTFIYSELGRDVLENLPDLSLIATRSIGVDHIDFDYCRSRRISVANVPTYCDNTVAEHVFALLLTISHRMLAATERARNGPFSPRGLQGFDLKGKTLGVIGTGHIGAFAIRIARGFGMDVLAFDVKPSPSLAKELAFRYTSFDAVLAAADVLTLHVPATSATRNLIGAREFTLMKDGVVLINTARGSVVDARALVQALQSEKVFAAGLDVLPGEPILRNETERVVSGFAARDDLRNLVASHVLLRMPNVVITPHNAFNTKEAVARLVATTIANIAAFIAGRPQNIIAPTEAAA